MPLRWAPVPRTGGVRARRDKAPGSTGSGYRSGDQGAQPRDGVVDEYGPRVVFGQVQHPAAPGADQGGGDGEQPGTQPLVPTVGRRSR